MNFIALQQKWYSLKKKRNMEFVTVAINTNFNVSYRETRLADKAYTKFMCSKAYLGMVATRQMHCGVHCHLFHWFFGKCFLVEVHPYMTCFCTFQQSLSNKYYLPLPYCDSAQHNTYICYGC